jgi:hypothetical protein
MHARTLLGRRSLVLLVSLIVATAAPTVFDPQATASTSGPSVVAVSVRTAPAAGGPRITVYGTNFRSVRAVRFGSVKGKAVKLLSATRLSVVVPAHTAGTVHVSVATNAGASHATAASRFTYTAASAPAMPRAVPAGYVRTFSEDFNRPAPVGTFSSTYPDLSQYRGCCSTNRITVYAANKVMSASQGSAFFDLHSENGQSYSAAAVPAKSGAWINFTYGQVGFAARLDSMVGSGYKMAFLLWPATLRWTNEIDIAETEPDLSGNPYTSSLLTTSTSLGQHRFAGGDRYPINLADHRYHTFLLTWQPTKITVTVDGSIVHTYTGAAVPQQAMHFVMQTEGWLKHGAVPTGSKAVLEVPWVYINTRSH